MNTGGGLPGTTDMATQGQPSKYTFCIAENEAENPWEPFHVERGFLASDSAVTVASAENPQNINDHWATTGQELLVTLAGSIVSMGSNNIQTQNGEPILALGPEHAALLAESGLSKDDIRKFLYENARVPRAGFHERIVSRFYPNMEKDTLIPLIPTKESLLILVVGGPGKHSAFLPTFGHSISVTKAVI